MYQAWLLLDRIDTRVQRLAIKRGGQGVAGKGGLRFIESALEMTLQLAINVML